jgi:[lysine-biosynthesis-protein LysW]--L-2-aminoadipate ligase
MMEDKNRGLVVHEVNSTVEFRGAASVSKADIPGAMIDYAVRIGRR